MEGEREEGEGEMGEGVGGGRECSCILVISLLTIGLQP
jgi:hypothetical protein